jgi:LacI family transcriptional regulator
MHAAGLASETRLFDLDDYHMQAARASVKGLLSQVPVPTAVVCHNDLTAIGIMAGLRERGVRVPADIAVVGMDDIEVASFLHPTLTTAGVAPRRVAAAFVDLLSPRLEQPGPGLPRRRKLRFALRFRESCGCPWGPRLNKED